MPRDELHMDQPEEISPATDETGPEVLEYDKIMKLSYELEHSIDRLREIAKSDKSALKDKGTFSDAIENVDCCFRDLANAQMEKLETVQDAKEISEACLDICLTFSSVRGLSVDSRSGIETKIVKNIYKLESAIENSNLDGLHNLYIFELAAEVADSDSYDEGQMAKDFIVKNWAKIEEYFKRDSFKTTFVTETVLKIFASVLNNGSEQEKDSVWQTVERLLKNKSTQHAGANILGGLLYCPEKMEKDDHVLDFTLYHHKDVENRGRELLQKTLQGCGVEEVRALSYAKKWTERSKARDHIVRENLLSVISLEELSAGSTKRLEDAYGIIDFGRYPVMMLIDQDENMYNTERPYGVIIFPKQDWNGAFHGHRHLFYDLRTSFKAPELNQYLIRVAECGNRNDVVRTLMKLDKDYGAQHKISFAIIGGHGTKDSINFGDGNSPRDRLHSKNLYKRGVKIVKNFFEGDATVILSSCSTGQKGGVGEALSKKFGMKVVAPTKPTATYKIEPFMRDGKMDFDVKYRKSGVEAVFTPEENIK